MHGDSKVEIDQIEYDSRLLKENSLFVAIKGFKEDGYDFVEQAKAAGAVAVMGEREHCDAIENHVTVPDVRQALADVAATIYGNPGLQIKACGVTGTNGKTTTCFLIKKILEARCKTTGLITSDVYDTGKETFPAERTTPESLDLQRLLYLMKQNYCVNVVIEVSSHALVLKRVENIDFRVAVYTNLTRDHLDFHGSMEAYLEAKALLAKKLSGALSYTVINLDVPEFRTFFGDFQSSHMSYSVADDSADVYCANYDIQPEGTVFDLVTPMGSRTVSLKLPGRFNLSNAIAAAAAGLACGVDVDNVVKGLESVMSVPGRLERLPAEQPFAVYVDYAHTPDAIEQLCASAREFCKGRLLLLFGCGGDRDRGKRAMMGAAAASADYAVVTTDNPRSEDPEKIIEDIRLGFIEENYEVITDRREAIAAILKMARPGDIVLLAGKGAESYQEINGKRYPFNDAEEARKILAESSHDARPPAEEN